MARMTANGVRRDRCKTGPVEVTVTCVVIVDIDDEEGCTTRRAMAEAAEQYVESAPQSYLKTVTCVDVEAMGCG